MSFFGDLFKILAIGAFFIATGPFSLAVSNTLATWLNIGGYVLGYLGSALDQSKRISRDQVYHMSVSPGTALPVIYGTAKVGGIVADWFVDTEFERKILYMAVPLAHGSQDGSGIKEVTSIFIDGLLGVVVDGDVRYNYFTTKALDYQVLLGTDSQNVGDTTLSGLDALYTDKALSDVSGSNWSATTDTGKGIACVIFRFFNLIVSDEHGTTYRGPPAISFIVQGNSIYDTRTSTWIDGGTNPAMCIRDYLTAPIYGCGFDASLIDTASFEDAADYCDDAITYTLIWTAATISTSSVANPSVITTTTNHGLISGDTARIAGHSGSTPSINGDHVVTFINATSFSIPVNVTVGGTGGTAAKVRQLAHRFTCNGVVDTSRSTADNLQALLSSCRGNLVWEQGKFKLTIRNGSPPAATVDLNPSNIIGEWSFRNAGLEDKWNVVKATYLEPFAQFKAQDVQWPPVSVTNNYLTADNGFVNELQMSLPFTNNQVMAQDICQVTLNERRLGITAQVRCTEAILAVSVGDLVTVTHPTPLWTAKPFWVTALQLMPDSTVGVNLQEYDTTAYDPDTMDDLRTFPATGLTPSNLTPTDTMLNGDFEFSGSLDGWTVRSGTAVLDTGNPFAGSNCLHLTATTLASATVEQTEPGGTTTRYVACSPGQRFRLSAIAGYVTGATGSGADGRINALFYDSGLSSLAGTTPAPSWLSWSTETSYTLKVVDVIAPAGAAYIGFTITLQVVVSGTAQFYMDQIRCTPWQR